MLLTPENSGIVLLGVPIDFPGSSQRTSSHWAAALLLHSLRLFLEGARQHALLRYYLGACLLVHLQRSTILQRACNGPHKLRDALQQNGQQKTSLGWANDLTWSQVTLPLRHSALGVRDPVQTQPAARIAALVNLEMFGRESVGVPALALASPSPDLVPTIATL